MSGVCAIAFARAAPPERLLETLTAALEFRGPEATRVWTEGGTGLGQTLLATTPEAAVEVLPLTDPASGCTLTADARLDNREDLARDLGVNLTARTVGDGELILLAYRRWGLDCAAHLLGDFTFVLWDPREQRLYAARDQMGGRQLYHARLADGTVAMATTPSALRALEPHRFPIRLARIADALEGLEAVEDDGTFFDGIFRLPQAHWLTADADGVRTARYWQLEPPPELKLRLDADYEAAFLEVFTEAVRCRLRCDGPVGSMLSGGMDSTAVCAVGAELLAKEGRGPLLTFSVAGPDPAVCPETRAIHVAQTLPGIAPHVVDHSDMGDLLPEIVAAAKAAELPFDMDMNLPAAAFARARRAGVKVVLEGGASDMIFSPGDTAVRHLRRGRVDRVLQHARGLRAFWNEGPTPIRYLAAASWRALVPAPVRNLRRDVFAPPRHDPPPYSMVEDELAVMVDMADRRRRYASVARRGASEAEVRANSIARLQAQVGHERYDRVAARFAVEDRDPFCDIRLIAFCLSLPPEQLEDRGWPKFLLRRALKGRVPDAIRWRRGKEHLGAATSERVFCDSHGWQEAADNFKKSLPALATASSYAKRSVWPGMKAEPDEWHMIVAARSLSTWFFRHRPADITPNPESLHVQ